MNADSVSRTPDIKTLQAEHLASRITEETRRYLLDESDPKHQTKAKYQQHMRELWSLVEAFGLHGRVCALLDPKGVAAMDQAQDGA